MTDKLIAFYPAIAAAFILCLFLLWYTHYDLVLLNTVRKVLRMLTFKFSELNNEGNISARLTELFAETNDTKLNNIWLRYSKKKDSEDAYDVFNPYEIITLRASRKSAEAVPYVLSTLGILAVFGGMALGILSIPDAAEPSELYAHLIKASSRGLFAGMVGIALSIVFQLLDKKMYNLTLNQLSSFCNSLTMLSINKEGKANEHSFANNDPSNRILKAFENLADEIRSFAGILSDKLDNIQNNTLENVTDSFLERLNTAAVSYHKELESSYERLSQAQKQSFEYITTFTEFSRASAERQIQINNFTEAAVENIFSTTEKLAHNAQLTSDATEKTKNFAALLTELMQNSLNNEQDLASRFSDIVKDLLYKLDTGMNSNIDRIGEASVKLIEELDNRVFSINVYTEVISKEIAELNTTLNSSVESFGKQMSDCIGNTFGSFDNSIADICERLGATAAAIRDSVDELPRLLSIYNNMREGQAGSDD